MSGLIASQTRGWPSAAPPGMSVAPSQATRRWETRTISGGAIMAGAGTDYAVFMISRYHDYLRRGAEFDAAVTSAMMRSVSGLTGNISPVKRCATPSGPTYTLSPSR